MLLDGPLDLLPGLEIRTAWDTHTQGGQYVVLTDHAGDRWVVTGDAMYSYENAEGIGGSGGYVNIGFGGGSGWDGLRLIDEMVKTVGDTNRLVIVHEYGHVHAAPRRAATTTASRSRSSCSHRERPPASARRGPPTPPRQRPRPPPRTREGVCDALEQSCSRRRAVVAAAALLALGLTACTVPSDNAGGPPAGGNGSKLVGIVTITATDANNARVIAGVTEAAKAAGWTVETVDAAGNADQANSAIRNFTSKNAGMIFDLVFPTSSLGAGLAAAQQAGIPVATWGGGLGTGVVMTTGDGAPFAQPATDQMVTDLGGSGVGPGPDLPRGPGVPRP